MIIYFILKIIFILLLFDAFLYLFNKISIVRWYYIHAFANFIICFYSWNPMIVLLSDPIKLIGNTPRCEETTIVIILVHIYHILFFKCTNADLFHHIAFVLLACISHYSVNFGFLAPFYHFFICGLPGGIDYLLLGLVKDNYINKNTRLKIAVELNTWLRAPGIIMAWSYCWIWYMVSVRDWIHLLSYIIITFASVINAQYYSRLITLTAGKKL